METAQRLNDRALGWLRYIWDKATTPDDWSDRGEPHPWWDRYTHPPMCSLPRFDLPYMAYVLPVMTEATPAWREAYVRIADELARRHTTFWGSIDWLTLIGPDPGVDRYPPEMLAFIPEKLRGRYAAPGWTGNGVEPWGLQPDPIGADGNLFNRGWLNLLLGMRRYVSGKADQDTPFDVTGYQNRQFTWTHARIAALISAQMAARPQGPHCENTKIWPFCVSAAGLGLKLYDALLETKLHAPFPRWVDYCRKHYMKVDGDNLTWFLWYYDPIEQRAVTFPEKTTAYSALTPMIYLYPQDRAFAEQLYTLSMRLLEWDNPKLPVTDLAGRPLNVATALFMARELGDSTTEGRLREYAETKLEPRFFGAENDRFAFWLGGDTEWPRGQVNAILMLSECCAPGMWWRVFNEPNLKMHSEPTLCGVDYPVLGIRRAQNDMVRGVLDVETTAATPSRRGTATHFDVKGVPDPGNVVVTANDQEFSQWHVSASDSIRIETDVDEHHFRIVFRAASPRSASALRAGASAAKEADRMSAAAELSELLGLAHPPVAISFREDKPSAEADAVAMQPAGCCYWALAQKSRLDTKSSDHANCSVGSYTHGLIDLEAAARGDDTTALLSSGWVGESDLANAPHLPFRPQLIRYEPLAESDQADVVLLHLSPTALMTLQGACPEIRLVTKPQCQIVPLAYTGEMVVSPGCAVSRVRTNLPAGELICAFHASDLPGVIGRLRRSAAADHAVAEYAAANDRQHFGDAAPV